MPNGIFHSLLAEEYLKTARRNVDVVAEKKKHFSDWLTAANNALKKKDFKIARDLYNELLKFINDDPYPDELNLEEEIIYYIRCCYCYSYATYLQVGKYFCESQESLDNLIRTLEFLRVSYPNKVLPVYLQIIYNLAIDSWVSIPEWCEILEKNEKKEQEIISNEMFKNLLPNINEIKNTKDHAIYLYYVNTQKTETDAFEELRDRRDLAAFKKRLRQRNRTMQTEESQKDVGQQTDKIKSANKQIQTVKHINSECQVDLSEEYSKTLQDIKTKLHMVQQKCDYTVQCLNEKLSDIQIKLNEENHQNRILKQHYDSLCAKYDVEIAELKEALGISKKLKELETKNNSKLQKLLLDLLQDKYNIRKTICDSLIDKAYFMISYLGELLPVLTPTTIPDKATVQKDIDYWHNQITMYTAHYSKLNDIYNGSKASIINSGTLDLTKSWPDLLKFLKDGNNIIFNSFKPAIRRIIDSENRMMQYVNNPLPPPPFPMNSGPSFNQPMDIVPNIYFQRQFDRMNYYGPQNYQPNNCQHPNSSQNYLPTTSLQNCQPASNIQSSPEISRTQSNHSSYMHSNVTDKSFNNVTIAPNHSNINADSLLSMASTKHKNNVQEERSNCSVSVISNQDIDGACSLLGSLRSHDNNQDDKYKLDEAKDNKPLILSHEEVDDAFSFFNLSKKIPEVTDLQGPLRDDLQRVYSKPSTPEDDPNVMSSEEMLLKYILENCPDNSEQEVTATLFEVLEQNGGSYVDIPEEIILQDVLACLRLKENQQIKKLKQIQRTNKKLDESCTICFENFRTAKTFSLPCQHVYHKHCIKRWLNKSNYCPICRHPCIINIK